MRHYHHLYWTALTGVSDTSPRSLDEITAFQLRAWEEHGFMVVSAQDERLDDEDRIDLHRIAERLFSDDRRHFRPSRR